MIVTWSDPRLARVPIRDRGETLVDVLSSAPLNVAKPPTFLRYGVVERLVTAQSVVTQRHLETKSGVVQSTMDGF